MARILFSVLALMMVVGGGLLTAGGNGWISDVPYDQSMWITLGPICAGLGVALLWVLWAPRKQR